MRKKILLFLAIFSIVLLGLCSCSDDKDDEYKDAIIGTWELVQVKVDGRWYPMIRPTYAKFNQDGTYVGRGGILGMVTVLMIYLVKSLHVMLMDMST